MAGKPIVYREAAARLTDAHPRHVQYRTGIDSSSSTRSSLLRDNSCP